MTESELDISKEFLLTAGLKFSMVRWFFLFPQIFISLHLCAIV